ncbi:hypothetical protein RFI_01218 [Reticulomyxa filosa]|uniref:Uncharacterized protein n=1 Tax=Reticulomyxa filosa TaxID=46433 RepID=X6PBC1_RETFI|nr:hypothetical protein RFI_01218 [Reticulomyxa filosa]|eukprot:ETO35845.1 hypothetical protein RFI_01218 [Reticulomyxa filosa]
MQLDNVKFLEVDDWTQTRPSEAMRGTSPPPIEEAPKSEGELEEDEIHEKPDPQACGSTRSSLSRTAKFVDITPRPSGADNIKTSPSNVQMVQPAIGSKTLHPNVLNHNNDHNSDNKNMSLDPKNVHEPHISVALSLSRVSLDITAQQRASTDANIIKTAADITTVIFVMFADTAIQEEKKKKNTARDADDIEEEEDDERQKKVTQLNKGKKSRDKLVTLMGVNAGRGKVTSGATRVGSDSRHAHDIIKVMRKVSLLVSLNVVVTFILLGGAFADMVLLLYIPIDLLVSAICILFLFQVPSFNRAYKFVCRPFERLLCSFIAKKEFQVILQNNKAAKHNLAIIEEYRHRKLEYLKASRASQMTSNNHDSLKPVIPLKDRTTHPTNLTSIIIASTTSDQHESEAVAKRKEQRHDSDSPSTASGMSKLNSSINSPFSVEIALSTLQTPNENKVASQDITEAKNDTGTANNWNDEKSKPNDIGASKRITYGKLSLPTLYSNRIADNDELYNQQLIPKSESMDEDMHIKRDDDNDANLSSIEDHITTKSNTTISEVKDTEDEHYDAKSDSDPNHFRLNTLASGGRQPSQNDSVSIHDTRTGVNASTTNKTPLQGLALQIPVKSIFGYEKTQKYSHVMADIRDIPSLKQMETLSFGESDVASRKLILQTSSISCCFSLFDETNSVDGRRASEYEGQPKDELSLGSAPLFLLDDGKSSGTNHSTGLDRRLDKSHISNPKKDRVTSNPAEETNQSADKVLHSSNTVIVPENKRQITFGSNSFLDHTNNYTNNTIKFADSLDSELMADGLNLDKPPHDKDNEHEQNQEHQHENTEPPKPNGQDDFETR